MGATVRAMANTATPREQVEEMERIRLQTEYDRAALQHFDALPVGAPSLALGHPYPVSVNRWSLPLTCHTSGPVLAACTPICLPTAQQLAAQWQSKRISHTQIPTCAG